MGTDVSKEKFWATKLVRMGKEEARYFIQDNEVYWQETGERITEIRVSERDNIIYEFSKIPKPGRLNVRLEHHRITAVIRMG